MTVGQSVGRSLHLSIALVDILNTDNVIVLIEVERLLGSGCLSWVLGAEDLIKFFKLWNLLAAVPR